MLFGIVYTPRKAEGPAVLSLELFGDWRPPVDFRGHWRFAAGGGMGVVEARTAAELTGSLAPFAAFFSFQVEQLAVEDGDGAAAPTGAWAELLPIA
jgi:hypothetical protein